MNRYLINDLKEGMVFSESIFIEGDHLLFPAGIAIKEKDISRIKSWGLDFIETNGIILSMPAKPKVSVTSHPGVGDNSESYKIYSYIIDKINVFCNSITASIPVDSNTINLISTQILKAIRDQRSSFVGFILGGEIKGKATAKSYVNTAILSALIAIEMKLPHHKVLYVISGALLHDVGMLRLPKAIVEKKGVLSAGEVQRIQSHTLHAYRIVSKEMNFPPDVGVIVLHHHERWDGTGYPRALKGEAIDLGARIVSVADAFEAMISQKPYRNSMIGYQAMKNLLSDNLKRFDPNVIKAFITTMGIYPIGSIVLLNNGIYARVEEVESSAPLRPKIRVLINEAGEIFKQNEGKLIDLLVEKTLFISKAVDPKEVISKNAQ